MKKFILVMSLFVFCGCSNPADVVIPDYQHDREHKKEYVRAVKRLSEHDRAMVRAYIGMCELYREPIQGAKIGQAIEIMEKFNGTR